jgi:NADPH-dependent 2,4-dienoyl-CoA reductase/sulfur reductase-like enzyme
MRVEHWTNASAQGRAAARNVAASATGRQDLRKPFADVPYFWSDQYGQKIQMVGWHQGHDRIELDRSADAPGPLARFYRDGRLIAAAGVNVPRIVMRLRRQIEEEARTQEAA